MRDQVINEIVENALLDSSIYLLLGDLGVYQARKGVNTIPQQIFNYGIREQSMISFATGISLAEGYPFVYSINPFINERAIEQIKNGPSYNDTPLCIITAGGTCDYYKLGKSHYCTNDINNLLAHNVPEIFMPFNEDEARTFTKLSITKRYFSYIRLSSSSMGGIQTNKFDKDYQGEINIYIGPDSLVFKKDNNGDGHDLFVSRINEGLLNNLSKSTLNCTKINLYAAFNASELFMKIIKSLAKAKKSSKDLVIGISHVPSIMERSVKTKEEILISSAETISMKI